MMSQWKKIVGSESVQEGWAPAFKELGLDYLSYQQPEDAASADCILFDARVKDWSKDLKALKARAKGAILSVVPADVDREDLKALKAQGSWGYLSESTPAEEVAIRLRSMMEEGAASEPKDLRGAKRVWFQENVEFEIFGRKQKAWSTTLSETGIFLHTLLSFPLYSVIHLKFHLLGEAAPFECDGVIVRQEVEGPIKGFGVMFQNLRGDTVRRLESFLELYK